MNNIKELKCFFYQLNGSMNVKKLINEYFLSIEDEVVSDTEAISDFNYYITDEVVKESEYVLFTIAKVNTKLEIKLDDIETQSRELIDKEDTQGLAVDAQFLYDYNNGILVQKRGQGQISIKDLIAFLSKKVKINEKCIDFALITDKNGIEKLNSLNQIYEFRYTVSIPKQLSLFASEVNDFDAGIELAKNLSGDSVEVRIHGESLNKRGLIDSIKLLNSYKEKQNTDIKSLNIYGENEIIDLVRNKLVYYKKVQVDELTTEDIYKFLKEAFLEKRSYLYYYEE